MSILLRSPTANSAIGFDFKQASSLTQHRIEHSSIKESSQLDSLTGNSQNLILTSGAALPAIPIPNQRGFEPQTSIITTPAFSTNKLIPFKKITHESQTGGGFITAKQKPQTEVSGSLQRLRRASCNIKEGKSVLKFSTLYVAKFIRRIKEVSSLMRFKEIGIAQFTIIKDISSDYNYFFMRGSFSGENSLTRLVWISIMFLVLIANLIYVPFRYSFSFQIGDQYDWFFTDLPVITFATDIFLNFFTAIYLKGLIITEHMIIIKTYLKGRFFWDILLFGIFLTGLQTNTYLDLIVVLRTRDLFDILLEIDERLRFRGRIQNFFELFKLVFFIIIFAHFIACSWHKIGQLGIENGEQITWMTALTKDSIPDSVFSFYITSFYWSVVTMITLGYGDIVPKNNNERVFVIFITQVSCIIFAYSMNSIGEILREMGRKRAMFKQQMGLMDTYMRKRNLSQLTQVKVRKYFEYLNKESMEDNEQSSRLISSLPLTLKEEVYSDVYGRVLNAKKIFYLHFSTPFLKDLALLMRERRLGPEEILFKESTSSDSLYFVMKGKVQLLLRTGEALKVLGKGDLFGEIQFFSDQVSEFKAITTNVTSLAVLRKEDFLTAILSYPKDYEQYCSMRDNLNLYKNIQGLDHRCMSCGSYSHRLPHCQYINFVRNEAKVLSLYTKYPDQKRTFFYGKRRNKFNSLAQFPYVYDAAVKAIFIATKSAKAQDLQEQLSDMESDSPLSNLDQSIASYQYIENDEAEISRAAISMISSVTPQFTKDFFQRTRLHAIAAATTFTGAVAKASHFSRLKQNNRSGAGGSVPHRSGTNQDSNKDISSNSSLGKPELGDETHKANPNSGINNNNNNNNYNNMDSEKNNINNYQEENNQINQRLNLNQTGNDDDYNDDDFFNPKEDDNSKEKDILEKDIISEDIISGTEINTPGPHLAFFSTDENLVIHQNNKNNNHYSSEARSSLTTNPTRFSFSKEPRYSFLNMSRPFDKRFDDVQSSTRIRQKSMQGIRNQRIERVFDIDDSLLRRKSDEVQKNNTNSILLDQGDKSEEQQQGELQTDNPISASNPSEILSPNSKEETEYKINPTKNRFPDPLKRTPNSINNNSNKNYSKWKNQFKSQNTPKNEKRYNQISQLSSATTTTVPLGFSQFLEINRQRTQTATLAEASLSSSSDNTIIFKNEQPPLAAIATVLSNSSPPQKARAFPKIYPSQMPTTPIQRWKKQQNDQAEALNASVNSASVIQANFNPLLSPIAGPTRSSFDQQSTPFMSQVQIKLESIKEDQQSNQSLTPVSSQVKNLAQRNLRQIKEENLETSRIDDNNNKNNLSQTSIRRKQQALPSSAINQPVTPFMAAAFAAISGLSPNDSRRLPTQVSDGITVGQDSRKPSQQHVNMPTDPFNYQLQIQMPHQLGTTAATSPNVHPGQAEYQPNEQFILNEHSLFAYNFDRLKEYEIYFPINNFTRVIAKSNSYRRKNQGYKSIMSKKRSQVRKRLAIFKQLQF